MLSKIRRSMDSVLKMALMLMMGLLVLDVLWQVFSRFVLRDPSSFTDELARYLMIWVAFFGGAYVTGKKAHVAIDLLSSTGKPWMRTAIVIAVLVFVALVLIIGGGRLVLLSFDLEQKSSALNFPVGYVYLALPVSGLFSLCYLILEFLEPNKPD